MTDLKRGDEYDRKMCMIENMEVPTQSEVKYRMSDDLAQVLFESILPTLQQYLGRCPPLEGPGDDLWISPSDLLIGKVRLKPPLTSKYIRALTHQGILDIGHVIEEKVENEHRLDKERALLENEIMLKYMAAKELREAVARAKEEKQREHEQIVLELKEQFKEELRLELERLAERLEIEKNEAVEAGKKEKEAEMQVKLELAVEETVCRLTEQFAIELFKQSKKLHEHFWYHIKQEKIKLKDAVNAERLHGQAKLEQLHAELQCENIANIMYVLANERRRCICEKQAIENNFVARIDVLEKELDERNEKLKEALKEIELSGREIKTREVVLFDIIKQFQKFIYFVLKSVPTQAEYLLNIEQLMIFELTKSLMESKPEMFENDKFKPPTETDSSMHTLFSNGAGALSSAAASDYHVNTLRTLVAGDVDYHKCDNYARYDPSEHTLDDFEDLPYFLFNENLYCREDFRNMISQGIKITKSNELWSFKNADVIEFIEPASKSSLEMKPAKGEIVRTGKPCEDHGRRDTFGSKKSFLSVRFSVMLPPITPVATEKEEVLQTKVYEEAQALPDKVTIEEEEIQEEETKSASKLISPNVSLESLDRTLNPSRLEMARDSFTLLMSKKLRSQSTISKDSKGTSVKHIRDSLVIHTKRSVDRKLSDTQEIIKRKESKLPFTVDSIELLKSKEAIIKSIPKGECREVFDKNRKRANIGVQCNNSFNNRSVAISHYEVIPDNSMKPTSAVNFYTKLKYIPEKVPSCQEDKNKFTYKRPPTSDRIYRKPSQVISVIGDPSSTEHLERQDEFTAKRVNSFIKIFRNNPSLRKLFIEAAKN